VCCRKSTLMNFLYFIMVQIWTFNLLIKKGVTNYLCYSLLVISLCVSEKTSDEIFIFVFTTLNVIFLHATLLNVVATLMIHVSTLGDASAQRRPLKVASPTPRLTTTSTTTTTPTTFRSRLKNRHLMRYHFFQNELECLTLKKLLLRLPYFIK
jgi:hypothetical protein